MTKHFLVIGLFILSTALYGQNIKRYFGAEKDDIDLVKEEFPPSRGGMPSKYSLFHLAPKIGNQDTIGSCVSWASAYAAMTIALKIENQNFDEIPFSPMAVHSAYKLYYDSLNKDFYKKYNYINEIYNRRSNCVDGASTWELLNRLKTYGTRRLEINEPQTMCYINPPHFTKYKDKIYDVTEIKKEVVDMKQALLLNSPLVIAIDSYSGTYWAYDYKFQEGVWDGINSGNISGGHAMVIVGFDDDKAGGCFQIMNSWGNDFGQNGTFWIKYEDVKKIRNIYRIVINPLKNNSLDKIQYKESQIPNPKKLELTELAYIVTEESDNYLTISDKNSNLIILDPSKKTISEISNFNSNQFAQGKRYSCILNKANNHLVIFKDFSTLLNLLKVQKDFEKTIDQEAQNIPSNLKLNLENIGKVKSLSIIENAKIKSKKNKFENVKVLISILNENNQAYLWNPYNNKVEKIFKHKKFDNLAQIAYNPTQKSLIGISRNGMIIQYNIEENQTLISKTSYENLRYDNSIQFPLFQNNSYDAFSHKIYAHNFDVNSELIEFKLIKPKNRIFRNKIRKAEIRYQSILAQNSFDMIRKLDTKKIIVLSKGKFSILDKYGINALKSTSTHAIENFECNPTKNLIVYFSDNTIYVEKINLPKLTLVKEFKNIHSLLGLTPDGSIVAKDMYGNIVYFNGNDFD